MTKTIVHHFDQKRLFDLYSFPSLVLSLDQKESLLLPVMSYTINDITDK